jgi:hypothetical protein
MKKNQFHVPFIKSLFIIAFVTIVSMASAHYFIYKSFSQAPNTPEYTSSPSYNTAKVAE